MSLVIAVAAGTVLAASDAAADDRRSCTWAPVDPAALRDFATRLAVELGQPDALDWSAAVDGAVLRFEARAAQGQGKVEVRVDAACREHWEVSGTLFADAGATRAFLRTLPRSTRVLASPPVAAGPVKRWIPALARDVSWAGDLFSPLHGGAQHAALWLVALVLGFSLVRSDASRIRFPERLLVPMLVLVAVMPLLDRAFCDDGAIQRTFSSVTGLGSDWHHPPLTLLLVTPAAWLSFEPWVLRLGPVLALLAQSWMVVYVATRLGGRLAGVLAGLWFACESRLWMGIPDLSGWGLAGFLFLSWIALLAEDVRQDRTGLRLRHLLLPALLVAGLLTSYVLIPAAFIVLVESVFVTSAARRKRWVLAPLALGALAVLAVGAFKFHEEAALPKRVQGVESVGQLAGLWIERSPLGRSLLMALPFLWTGFRLPLEWRDRGIRLLVLGTGATLIALLLMTGHVVVKDYYADALWGGGCVLAGVCVARGMRELAMHPRLRSGLPGWLRLVLPAVLLLPGLSFREPNRCAPQRYDLDFVVWRLADDLGAPVYSSGPEAGRTVAFEGIRRGEFPLAAAGPAQPGIPSAEALVVDAGDALKRPCELPAGPGGWFFVVSRDGLADSGACRPLFPGDGPNRHWVCRACALRAGGGT